MTKVRGLFADQEGGFPGEIGGGGGGGGGYVHQRQKGCELSVKSV